jgi:hypothetical protein
MGKVLPKAQVRNERAIVVSNRITIRKIDAERKELTVNIL